MNANAQCDPMEGAVMGRGGYVESYRGSAPMDSPHKAPQKSIPCEIIQIQEQLNRVESVLGSHEERLESVLGHSAPECDSAKSVGESCPPCRVAEELANIKRRISAIAYRIEDLTDRVEV